MTTLHNLPAHHPESLSGAGLNRLRASVLGANDGIVSVAAIVVGIAGASSSPNVVLAGGVAGLVAGALSMAAGEYVSVSAQRDAERSAGLSTSAQTNPWHAASASLTAFLAGGIVPLLVVLMPWPSALTVPVVVGAVVLALVATGWVSARAGGASARRAVLRNVVGGTVAMAATYGVGTLVGLVI